MQVNTQNRLRIALQKSGRLSEDSLNLVSQCGIKLRKRDDQLFCHSENFPLDILFVRDDDIPNLVMDGICDFGMVGTNVLQEKALARDGEGYENLIAEVQALDFGKCQLALAVPDHFNYQNLKSLEGLRIATSYPRLLSQFLKQNKMNAHVVTLTGSVEIAPRLGIAEAICDLVLTGATLESNNLKKVEKVFESEAVLIKGNHPFSAEKQKTAALFQTRLQGVLQASGSKYIMMHAPRAALKDIVALIPGAENPSILPLQGDSDKVAIHALCRESVFWETMEKLKAAGASAILILPVEKMLA